MHLENHGYCDQVHNLNSLNWSPITEKNSAEVFDLLPYKQ